METTRRECREAMTKLLTIQLRMQKLALCFESNRSVAVAAGHLQQAQTWQQLADAHMKIVRELVQPIQVLSELADRAPIAGGFDEIVGEIAVSAMNAAQRGAPL